MKIKQTIVAVFAIGLVGCADKDPSPPAQQHQPLNTSAIDEAQCWDLLQVAADKYWAQLEAMLLPPQPTCHTESAPKIVQPLPQPSKAIASATVTDTRALPPSAGAGSGAGSGSGSDAGSGSGSGDYGNNAPETDQAVSDPTPVESCEYTTEEIANDTHARALMADFDNAFTAWLAEQSEIEIDGALYSGSDLLVCHQRVEADPVEPPDPQGCTATTAGEARFADDPACPPTENLNCMAIVHPTVNSYAHHPAKESDRAGGGCQPLNWTKMIRQWWSYWPNAANGNWGGAMGVNAFGGWGRRNDPLSFDTVNSCSQQTDSLSVGKRLEFKPRVWFVPRQVWDGQKKQWVANEKLWGNFYGPDGKKHGPTCDTKDLPYDKLIVKARYAPKLKEVFSGRTSIDDDARITAGLATNDMRAEVQGNLVCRAPSTAVTNPDTFSVVQGSVDVPFHAKMEPECTTEVGGSVDAHGSYQTNGQGGVTLGVTGSAKESCGKKSGTAISMAVSCDLIGGADMIRAYTSEIDMATYSTACEGNKGCAPIDFQQGNNQPLPFLSIAWELNNTYAWARSAGTGCDFLGKRTCAAHAFFKTGSTDLQEDGPKQNKDSTMLWEGNTCQVFRKTQMMESTVPSTDIPCYWTGQKGDAPAPIKYRFDPKNYKWDPDKNPQP